MPRRDAGAGAVAADDSGHDAGLIRVDGDELARTGTER
jgi:hypothetical protein